MNFGTYHALVIGNYDYAKLPKLETAVADAEAIAELLKTRYGFKVQLLRNATRNDILRALNRYRAELTEDDNLLVYYAGHGWLDRQSNTGFWQPVDAEADDDLNWIANEALTRRLLSMNARHVMVVADSCYSGTLVRSASSALPTARDRDTWLQRVAEKRSRTAIVSGGLEPVADTGRGGHSVFANAILAALGENRDILEATALFKQLSRAVVVNADQTPQYADIRRAGHEGGEFLFVPKGLTQAAAAAPQTAAPTGQSRSGAANSGLELAFWQSIQASERAADFEAYLEQFPNGAFVPLARNRVAALSPPKTTPKDIAGAWVSGVLTNPFDRHDRYRLRLDLKRLGTKVLGSVSRNSAEDARRKYRTAARGIT
ncbi:MAG: caspase family protein, partial [Rhodospirillaceae bacterium]|nr:caspase family protein [Rhodospirillaceae bacterium]